MPNRSGGGFFSRMFNRVRRAFGGGARRSGSGSRNT